MRDTSLKRLSALEGNPVVILGGGVHGAAVFRELALNHVPCIMLDTSDFCKGATSTSSRIAHGGLRYLEHGHFTLVREALNERNRLLKYASHLTEPVVFNVPVESVMKGCVLRVKHFFSRKKKRARVDLLSLKLGLMLYDWFSGRETRLPKHKVNLRFGKFLFGLNKKVIGVVRYFDGRISDPEGLVFEMITEAVEAQIGSVALNYTAWRWSADGTMTIYPSNCAATDVMPSLVVNATGVHIDEVNALLGCPTDFVSGVRGTHIVVCHEEMHKRMNGEVFYFDDGTGRMVVAVPLEKTILMGTTEVMEPPSDKVTISADEVDYLSNTLSKLFDDFEVSRSDIIGATTGFRALKKMTGNDATKASRDHELLQTKADTKSDIMIFSMIGGKWTTFRSFASYAADHIMDHLDIRRTISTETRPYIGSPIYAHETPQNVKEKLLQSRYGSRWSQVSEYCNQETDRPLKYVADYSEREIKWLVKTRSALHLDDLIVRRTKLAIEGLVTPEALQEVAEIMTNLFEYDDFWVEKEVCKCSKLQNIFFNPPL